MSRKKRGLSDNDLELWREVIRTMRPLSAKGQRKTSLQKSSKVAKNYSIQLQEADQAISKIKPKGKEALKAQNSSIRAVSPSPQPQSLKPFRIGEKAQNTLSHSNDVRAQIHSNTIHMDAKAYRKMLQGKIYPEATIDLHGLTLNEAQPALSSFIMGAYSKKARLLLVITGKGKQKPDYEAPIPQRIGILRYQVPIWLRKNPLASMVLQVKEASPKHGGSGAYYVYLRRPRDTS